MKLKKGFVVKAVGGKKVAVATGELSETFKGMISLNETADFIFGKLNSGCASESEIVALLVEEYDVSAETAEKDVSAFVAKLRELDLVDG